MLVDFLPSGLPCSLQVPTHGGVKLTFHTLIKDGLVMQSNLTCWLIFWYALTFLSSMQCKEDGFIGYFDGM